MGFYGQNDFKLRERGELMYQVLLDNKLLFSGTDNQCFEFILKHQGFSVDYALKHGGYQIKKEVN